MRCWRAPASLQCSARWCARSNPRGLVADEATIAPNDIATAVNDLMAAHGKLPIASDMGDCLFHGNGHRAHGAGGARLLRDDGLWRAGRPGLQAATGQRPLIPVGDGAFQMTGWELGNCRRYGWDPIVLLFNNASWEMLRTFQPESGFNNLDDWGFAFDGRWHGRRRRARRRGVSCRQRWRRRWLHAAASS